MLPPPPKKKERKNYVNNHVICCWGTEVCLFGKYWRKCEICYTIICFGVYMFDNILRVNGF